MTRPGFAFALLASSFAFSQASITTPKQFFGHDVGDDYYLSNYAQFSDYWRLLDKESDRMTVQVIGKTEEGRDQLMAIVTSPRNQRRIKRYQEISKKLCLADGVSPDEARALAKEGKAVVWIDGGLHANEVLGAQQLIETSFQMVSRNDDEAKRILDNVIILFVHANPDGMELVSNWYMQESDPKKRNFRIPRLYQKYIGHDNNRDFYAVTQSETKNMNNVMYRQWFPQIMYNHHQTGPAGTVMFAPPFRDPFNYNIDPQVMTGLELVGSAMQNRFAEENKPGVTVRTGSNYSAWWNGGLRTTAYFHNIIGLLTETIGSPTPMRIPFVSDRIVSKGNLIYPIEPQEWKFRQSVDYSVTANMAILDLAAKRREEFLFGIYSMGKRQIEKGRKDTWTDIPSRATEAKALADLRKPELRDPKVYVFSYGQTDHSGIPELIKALELNGIQIEQATEPFTANGKTYGVGTAFIRTAQAFRAHILDMFEPQDHPNDIPAPGAPPTPPYDSAGYTLAMQMGVQADRILDAIKIKSEPLGKGSNNTLANATNGPWWGVASSVKSYEGLFPLLKSQSESSKGNLVARIMDSGKDLQFLEIENLSKDEKYAYRLKLPRVALWDRYGGSMESGWTRWIMDKFGVQYQVIYSSELDAGDLKSKFDAIVLVGGAIPATLGDSRPANTEGIPEKYQYMLKNVDRTTVGKLKEFAEAGGSIITIGSSTNLAKHFGLPIESYLMRDGKAISRNDYYIPGSILQVQVDNQQSVAWGMGERADVMFDNSPVFRITGPSEIKPIAWFDTETPLRSGWAWGQNYLKGGIAIAEAKVGKGTLYLFGPEILYRGQSWGTFKLFFNALLLSRAEKM